MKHKLKPISVVLLIIFCVSSFTACYDARELDDYAFVNMIGVDKGVADKLRFTILFPTLKGTSSSGNAKGMMKSSQVNDYSVISIDCPTAYAGINMINTSLSRTVNYSQAKYFVISEELARKGTEAFINGMVRTRQIRRAMYIMVVKGKASDFIKEYSPIVGTAVSRSQEDMIEKEQETGLFDATTYYEFINNIKSYYRMPTATLVALNDFSNYKSSGAEQEGFKAPGDYYAGELPREGGDKAEFIGLAIFDGDKMVGELNGEEARTRLMITNEFKRGSIVIPDPNNSNVRIAVDARPEKDTNVKVKFENGEPVISVKVFLEGDLVNLQSTYNYESGDLKKLLEEKYSEYIKEVMDRTIDKCKNLNADIFHFGDRAAMHFGTIQELEAYNWNGHFKNAEVDTEVKFIIRRTGTMVRTNPTITSEGAKE